MTAAAIRKRTWDVPADAPQWAKQLASDVGEMARDINQYLSALPAVATYDVETVYTEPLYLALPKSPKLIIAARIRDKVAPETPLLTGGLCHFAWEGARARINSIDGMSVGSNKTFLISYLVVG